jgi:hypothetical protein
VKFTMRVKAPGGITSPRVKSECARVKLALHVARRAKTWREYTAALDAFAWLFDR